MVSPHPPYSFPVSFPTLQRRMMTGPQWSELMSAAVWGSDREGERERDEEEEEGGGGRPTDTQRY